jgi:hypothetical protein
LFLLFKESQRIKTGIFHLGGLLFHFGRKKSFT